MHEDITSIPRHRSTLISRFFHQNFSFGGSIRFQSDRTVPPLFQNVRNLALVTELPDVQHASGLSQYRSGDHSGLVLIPSEAHKPGFGTLIGRARSKQLQVGQLSGSPSSEADEFRTVLTSLGCSLEQSAVVRTESDRSWTSLRNNSFSRGPVFSAMPWYKRYVVAPALCLCGNGRVNYVERKREKARYTEASGEGGELERMTECNGG